MKRYLFILFLLYPLYVGAVAGDVITSFRSPGDYPSGLTFDGKYLWTSDFKNDKIYQLNTNGDIIKTIESPAYYPTGLAWDGKYLWCSDIKGLIPQGDEYHRGKIFKIDPITGDVLHTIDAPSASPISIAWDGKYLWCVDDITHKLIQFDPNDGTTIREFISPASSPQGITFDGQYLWVSDRIRDKIYRVDPKNGNVILSISSPGKYSRDLAWDGSHLWNVDLQNTQIYKLVIADGVKYKKSNPSRSHFKYMHNIRNYGPGKILTAEVNIAVPTNRVNQEITSTISCSPKAKLVTDNWGQKTYLFTYKNIAPSEYRESVMQLDYTSYDVQWFLYPDQCGNLSEIPEAISKKYLSDNAKYDIHNRVITKAVTEAVGNEKNSYWVMRNVFNYLISHLYYKRVGGWNTASTVLARGNGSCSEYSFVFIAMCRAAGLPARYVGAVAQRGDKRSIDDVFHRWVEVYLPNYGWIPIDPSGGDQKYPADQERYIGHLSNHFIITTQGGGGSNTLGWNYNSNESYQTEPKTNVAIDYWGEMSPLK